MKESYRTFAYLPVPYMILDETLAPVAASREAGRVLGTRCRPNPDDEDLSRLSEALAGHCDLIALIGASTLKLRHEGSRDRQMWRDGGRVYAVTVVALPNPDGAGFRYGVCVQDKTEQAAFDRERESARMYLEETLNSLPVGVTVMDAALRITSVNRAELAFLESVGVEGSLLHVIGQPARQLFPGGSELWDRVLPEVVQAGGLIEHTVTTSGAGAASRVRSVRIAPLRQAEERVAGAIRISEDITERERMARELKEADVLSARLETIREVVATLNHEINNALTAVMGNAETLKFLGDKAAPDTRNAMLDEIVVHAEKISEVTRRLRALDHVESERYLDDDTYGGDRLIDWQKE